MSDFPDVEKDQNGRRKSTLTRYVDGEIQKEVVLEAPPGDRKMSYASGRSRRMSQWDAIVIAKEGGEEVDEEIAELEQELQQNPLKKHLFSPEIKFKDPRHFTWLLVGFASMG